MYLNFSLHDQDAHLAELWHEDFIKNLFCELQESRWPVNTFELCRVLPDDKFDFPPAESAN